MVETRNDFHSRVRSLGRKHRAMSKTGGAVTVRKDGLIVIRPKRAAATRGYFPIRGLAVLMICFFGFKGFLLTSMGDAAYADRLTKLRAGTVVEQAGAVLMQPEAVSLLFAKTITDLKS